MSLKRIRKQYLHTFLSAFFICTSGVLIGTALADKINETIKNIDPNSLENKRQAALVRWMQNNLPPVDPCESEKERHRIWLKENSGTPNKRLNVEQYESLSNQVKECERRHPQYETARAAYADKLKKAMASILEERPITKEEQEKIISDRNKRWQENCVKRDLSLLQALRSACLVNVDAALANGDSWNDVDNAGHYAIAIAVSYWDEGTIESFLDQAGRLDQAALDQTLRAAVSRSYLRLADTLVRRGANVNTNILSNVVRQAVYNQSESLMKEYRAKIDFLLSHNVDVNQVHPKQGSYSLLYYAVQLDDTSILESLLERGARMQPEVDQFSPLGKIIVDNRADVLKIFMRYGMVDGAVFYRGSSPLNVAAKLGRTDLVKLLVEHGAVIDHKSGPFNETALMTATRYAQPEVVHYLLLQGADMRVTNKKHYAVLNIAKGLERKPVDNTLFSTVRSNFPKTASEEEVKSIIKSRQSEVVAMLEEYGAEFSERPLGRIKCLGSPAMCERLKKRLKSK